MIQYLMKKINQLQKVQIQFKKQKSDKEKLVFKNMQKIQMYLQMRFLQIKIRIRDCKYLLNNRTILQIK